MITYFYFKILAPIIATLIGIFCVLEIIVVLTLFVRNQKNKVKIGHQSFGDYTTKHVWGKLEFTKKNLIMWVPYYLVTILVSFYIYSFFSELFTDPNYRNYMTAITVIILPWIAPLDYQRVNSINHPILVVKIYWISSLFICIIGFFVVNFPNLFDKYELLFGAVWPLVTTFGITFPLFFLSVDTILIPWYRINLKEKNYGDPNLR